MKHLPFFLLLIVLPWEPSYAQNPIVGNAADLPFSIEIEDVTQDELPGFHSMAFARWEGWWVLIGGRLGGLHGFFPLTAFPENEANASIWLIDPETGSAHNFGVDALTVPFHDPLKATNPQYVQSGEYLYLCGGYGKEAATGNFITFPVLTAVHLPQLVSAMLSNSNPSAAFRQIESEKLRVCGGEMDQLGEYYYLVGGHNFSGNYTQVPSPMFTQEYTYEIRKFKIAHTPSTLAITDYSAHHDEQNLRRRDFTLSPLITPGGLPALGLYGGVFRPDVDLPYYNPVYITESQTFSIDNNYAQVFSQYTCPTVPMFDSTDGSMYTLFFGGLSVYHFDQNTQSIKYDEKVPFIRDISTFLRRSDGSSQEFLMPQTFDELLGANMIFVPSEEAPQYDNEVLKLRAMGGKTFAGWLFGGIKADIPNLTPSSANERMFKVYINPKTSLSSQDILTGRPIMKISPNPWTSGEAMDIEIFGDVYNILLFNANGALLGRFGKDTIALKQGLEQLPSGVYFLQSFGDKGSVVGKLLKT